MRGSFFIPPLPSTGSGYDDAAAIRATETARLSAKNEAIVYAGMQSQAAKDAAIAYSISQTQALENRVNNAIAVEAEARRKAQMASDSATKNKFEQIARDARDLALKSDEERKQLFNQNEKMRIETIAERKKLSEQIEKNKIDAKNEAIAYSLRQTQALENTVVKSIAVEAEATRKAQMASDSARKKKFQQIAQDAKELALQRDEERKQLLEQIEIFRNEAIQERTQLLEKIEKNKIETDTQIMDEIGKIKKWQDKHTKMPLNFMINFLPSKV
jgi:hypothetical protein